MKVNKIIIFVCAFLCLLSSCAKMGQPDGGWYDETPPKVIGASPEDKGINVTKKRISIFFDEYVTIENATENVVISPPQMEPPEIKGQGQRININLIDSLIPNTTYTIDFSDAIKDNNEGNPLGNYTYSFSTGDHIDTLEVSGYVLSAEDLEPVAGILVGLYGTSEDSVFHTQPMMRIARTDASGHYVIKGIAPGYYRAVALKDADGNYMFNQKSEMIAFDDQRIEPTCKPDIRQDTTWTDSLHIASIERVHYTHFLPDDICLRAFNEVVTDRYFVKAERKDADHFTLFYTYGDSILPEIQGLNFNADNAFVIEPSAKKDTITYWLRDTTLINQDTLSIALHHHITDTLGILQQQVDTINILAKTPYAKRLKDQQKKYETWLKGEKKKAKKGEPIDSIMPIEPLKLNITPRGDMDPDENVTISATMPINDIDTAAVHLYSHPKGDTLWYNERYELQRINGESYRLKAAWRPEMEYSLEIDSAAISNIYGLVADKVKQGLKVRALSEYATIIVSMPGTDGKHVMAQLIDASGKLVKEVYTDNGQAEFFYIKAGKYFLRAYIDANGNRQWDTGDYDAHRQSEEVYYYPEQLECRAKWDLPVTWNFTARPLYNQKPAALVKQKDSKKKKVLQHRNLDRAKKLGIEYIPKV